MNVHPDKAGIIAPPPLIYLGILALALCIDWLQPVALVPERARPLLGWPFVVGGTLLLLLSILSMQRARTAVNPYKATTAVVGSGPYRYSRNPMYVAMALVYIGIAILVNTLWPMVLLPAAVLIMHQGVIVREERYLERKFGDAYLQYKAKVRRWL